MKPKPIAVWHEAVARNDLAAFEALLTDDAVFHSPAIHTPQVGRDRVSMYLRGALLVLNNGTFRYTDEWFGPRSAVLEFEARVDGLDVNGVDIVRWNDDERVTHFKVMVRPYKGLTALMAAMQKLLQT
jgi:hypothetical protein